MRIFEDPEVVALVKEKGVTLEMCPTSNVQTQAIDNLLEYPFMMYLDEGIKVTLNTDDMAIERTTLANEFRIMEEKKQEPQIIEVNHNGKDGQYRVQIRSR